MHKAFFFVKSKNPNQSCTGRLQRSVGGGKINYFVEKHFYRGASATYSYEISGRGRIEIKKILIIYTRTFSEERNGVIYASMTLLVCVRQLECDIATDSIQM